MIFGVQVGTPARGWHLRLAARIEAEGHRVVLRQVASRRAGGGALVLERRLYGAVADGFEPVNPRSAVASGACDVLVAIEGEGTGDFIEVLFDGGRGEPALIDALLRGRAPLVEVRGMAGVLATGLPAVDDPHVLARALAQVLVRVEDLIVQALRRTMDGAPAPPSTATIGRPTSPPGFLARGVAAKLARRFGPARGRPDHWRVAYRSDDAPFTVLPDDGERFYADPFPFEWGGRRVLFFEDYPYRTRKGVIGCVEVDGAGRTSPPRTVLERPVHLSYPFVFRDGDAVFMLPEMGAARRVQLFRATSFPDRWVPDRVLLDDVVAADATLVRHEGAWWLFATLSGDGGSTRDKLCLFHAPALAGPWVPHVGNPVLIDAGAARPAGAMWHEDGVLMRAAQDCRRGYGDAVALCRVDRLDPAGFRQTVVARLDAPAGFVADGTHTHNRSAGLEAIDLRVRHPAPTRAPKG